MSEAPHSPAKPAAHVPPDPVEELARQIFIQLSARVYSARGVPEGSQPAPKAVVGISFKLAEAFLAGNLEFNTAARARREAELKASVDVSKIEIDFGAIGTESKK